MNVFIILSILIIVIGVLLLVATPSVLFKLNWEEKTGKEKILMYLYHTDVINLFQKNKCLLTFLSCEQLNQFS